MCVYLVISPYYFPSFIISITYAADFNVMYDHTCCLCCLYRSAASRFIVFISVVSRLGPTEFSVPGRRRMTRDAEIVFRPSLILVKETGGKEPSNIEHIQYFSSITFSHPLS